MAKARLYSLKNDAAPKKELRGQAKVVFDVMSANRTPRLASDIAADVEASGNLKTRQDVLRVTLYYIIVFRNAGLVDAAEQEIEAEVEETETVEAE